MGEMAISVVYEMQGAICILKCSLGSYLKNIYIKYINKLADLPHKATGIV